MEEDKPTHRFVLFDKLDQLLEERRNLDPEVFPHLTELIDNQLELIASGQENEKYIEIHHEKPIRLVYKIRVPVEEQPEVNYVGRIVGQGGSNIQSLKQMTGCKVSVYGRGSIRDKTKEQELKEQGGKYSHLNHDLHVAVECFAPALNAYQRMAKALTVIHPLLTTEKNMFNEQEIFSDHQMMPGRPSLMPMHPPSGPRGGRGSMRMAGGARRGGSSSREPAMGRGQSSARRPMPRMMARGSSKSSDFASNDFYDVGFERTPSQSYSSSRNGGYGDSANSYYEEEGDSGWNGGSRMAQAPRRGLKRSRPY